MSADNKVFDFEGFYRAIDLTREARGLNWKQVSEQSSVHTSTLARMGQQKRPDADGLAALSAWSGINPADYVACEKSGAEPLAKIGEELRRDPRLTESSARVLEEIIRSAYAQLVKK